MSPPDSNPVPRRLSLRRVLPAALALLAGAVWPCAGQVVISEFMADNVTTVFVDEDDDHEDWLELHNTSTNATVSLNGWFLRDGGDTWRFPLASPAVSLGPDARLRVWCSGKDRRADAARLHTSFKLSRTGEYLALLRPDGLTVEHAYAPAYPVQYANRSYGLPGTDAWQPLVGPAEGAASYTLAARARVPSSSAQQNDLWRTAGFNDSGWTARSIGLEGGILKGIGFDTTGARSYLVHSAGRIQTSGDGEQMYNVRASVHLRFPFTVADAAQVRQLQLRARYEDGFIAYVNGQKVLEAAAPASPAFNSASTSDREDDQCEDFDLFNLPGAQAHLVTGANVLAIQGLNNASNNTLFVMTPWLEARMPAPGVTNTVGYLQQPTPGADNTTVITALGPDITLTTRNPPRPAASAAAPFTVTTRVAATLRPVQSVTLRYVRMFDQAAGAENSLAMLDNGTGGDLVAGDGVYTGLIPGSFMQTIATGQMLRWRVVAQDTAGNVSTDPPYLDPRNSDRYFGVITRTPGVVSNLPVLHWLASAQSTHNGQTNHNFSQAASNSRTASTGCFYYQEPGAAEGRFHDNVRFSLHGQSTGGFDKKSQNVNFNRDNPFVWRTGEAPVGSVNLLSNYADKSRIRNTLAWEFWNATRHPSHWCQPVRVQQVIPATVAGGESAQFYGIWDMTEDGNADFLDRVGLDRDGALYKCYNSLDNATQTASNASGVEKKTREWEDFSDLAALVTALNPSNSMSARRQWTYDNVDVPALVNLLAMHLFIRSNDMGHKNYYIYRDTNGSREWTLLPWDQDLSFGHTWVSGPSYFDDDIDSARGLVSGSTANNRLMRLISADHASSPELAAMYLRRLRTLMDTWLGPDTAPVAHFEGRVAHWLDVMDPNPGNYAAGTDDADLDYRKWGFWTDGSGSNRLYTAAGAADHFLRAHGLRITSSNPVPPYPGAAPYATYGTDPVHHSTLPAFLPGRRSYLYRTDASRPMLGTLVIPAAQPPAPALVIESVNFNPGAAGQDGEYFILRNPSAAAVDISDWRLAGEIEHTFRPGTVIPGAGTATSDGASSAWVNQLVVAKKAEAFRARAVSPKAGEYRHVQGGYKGQLSARGGVIQLLRPLDRLNLTNSLYAVVATNLYAGAPTGAQLGLRVSELMFNPAPPTQAESLLAPGAAAGDFEFIELVNAGATTLALAGASFARGVDFVFPSSPVSTLAAGGRRLIVSNLTAFRARYGGGLDGIILGEYEGSLDNAGEELQLLDAAGEVVLEFTYGDDWHPPADGAGYSLVTRDEATAHNRFGRPVSWFASGAGGGTPGADDAAYSQSFAGWRWDHFAEADVTATNLAVQAAGDPDGDGRDNFSEYAFGGSPVTADAGIPVVAGWTNVSGQVHITLRHRRAALARDLAYTVESGENLVDWAPVAVETVSVTPAGGLSEDVLLRESAPAGPGRRYFRVRAAAP